MKLRDNTSIDGIPTYEEGARLSFAGYKDINIPAGYNNIITYPPSAAEGSAFAKSFEKDNILYISIAGTDELDSLNNDLGNWITKGGHHFQKLDPYIGPVIQNAAKEGKKVVVLGDSGGGLAAQFFRYKYDVDIFVTNTTHVNERNFRNRTGENSSISHSQAIALNVSGEPLSAVTSNLLDRWGDVQAYYVPSELGVQILVSEKYEKNPLAYFGSRIDLHTDKEILVGKYGNYPLQNTPWTLEDYIRNPDVRYLYDNAEKRWREKIEDIQRWYNNFEYDGITQRNYILNTDFFVAEGKEIFQLCIEKTYYDTLDT